MKKLGLTGLALIASILAPSSAKALVGETADGRIEVFSSSDPRYSLHSCKYNGNTLRIKCDEFGDERCFVDEVYNQEQGKVLSPFSVDLPPELILIPGINYCIKAAAKYQ